MKEQIKTQPRDSDPFGLQKIGFRIRKPEHSEMFDSDERSAYIHGCDFRNSADDLLLAWEIQQRFGDLTTATIVDAMCGPGRLGRELTIVGNAGHVIFQDGDSQMLAHAAFMADWSGIPQGRFSINQSLIGDIGLPGDTANFVFSHNSTHQLGSIDGLRNAIREMVRIVKPGGFVMIADFQRGWSPKFIDALNERLRFTRPDIVPLLLPTFQAAFTKDEMGGILASLNSIQRFSVVDAGLPELNADMQARVALDPVRGHVLDFSPISMRVIIQKSFNQGDTV